MSLRTRTQEVEGHLCILSKEMNQGLKTTSSASVPGSQVPGWESYSLGYGGWWPPTSHQKQNCLGLDENEFRTISGYSLHRADWSRWLPSFFIFNVQCSNREWGASDVAKNTGWECSAFESSVMRSLVGEDMDSLGQFKYRPNGIDLTSEKQGHLFFYPFWHVK